MSASASSVLLFWGAIERESVCEGLGPFAVSSSESDADEFVIVAYRGTRLGQRVRAQLNDATQHCEHAGVVSFVYTFE